MSGFDVLEKINSDPEFRDACVVFIFVAGSTGTITFNGGNPLFLTITLIIVDAVPFYLSKSIFKREEILTSKFICANRHLLHGVNSAKLFDTGLLERESKWAVDRRY